MPPKGYRKSMPGRLNNTTMLTPSRRSPRVPASKSINESVQPTKSLDLSSTDPPNSSSNIHSYNPKTPSKPSSPDFRHRSDSPDTSLSRRRTFQAQPSRLSTVYTPVVETPSSNTSRRTLRSAVNDTPQNQLSDDDFAETGWTLEQYLGLGNEEDMAGQTSPTKASSQATRTSARVRKPTERFIESQNSQQNARRKKAALPAAPQKEVQPTGQKTKTLQKGILKPVLEPNLVKQTKHVQLESGLLGIEIDGGQAGQRLAKLTAAALSSDFNISDDPYKLLVDAREYWADIELELAAAQGVQPDEAEAPEADKPVKPAKPVRAAKPVKPVKPVEPVQSAKPVKTAKPVKPVEPAKPLKAKPVKAAKSVKPAKPVKAAEPVEPVPPKIILKFKKSTPPNIDTDGWVKTGRVNDSGEEIVLTPTDHSPYRSPRTYGDEALPYPPVRSRSEQQVEEDTALGFPPLLGYRNIPSDEEVHFKQEDIEGEMARLKAVPETVPEIAPKAAAKTARKTARKTASKTAAKAPSTAPARPMFQRLKLNLKPAPQEEAQPASDKIVKGKRGEVALTSDDDRPKEIVAKATKKGPVVAKGKKRKAEVISDGEEPKGPASKAAKKQSAIAEPTISTGRGRGATRVARGTQGSRAVRGPRGTRISRGRGRGRGAATETVAGTDTGSRGGRGAARGAGRVRGRRAHAV